MYKKFETEFSVSDFSRLILKSPNKITCLFSLLACSRRGRRNSSLNSSIDMQ